MKMMTVIISKCTQKYVSSEKGVPVKGTIVITSIQKNVKNLKTIEYVVMNMNAKIIILKFASNIEKLVIVEI